MERQTILDWKISKEVKETNLETDTGQVFLIHRTSYSEINNLVELFETLIGVTSKGLRQICALYGKLPYFSTMVIQINEIYFFRVSFSKGWAKYYINENYQYCQSHQKLMVTVHMLCWNKKKYKKNSSKFSSFKRNK